ncbi:hypothetical protein N2152v2_002804 [Parachlorella kessleri]
MSSLLKRLSMSLDRPSLAGPRDQREPAAGLASHPSFNDFSFHVNSEVHEEGLAPIFPRSAALKIPKSGAEKSPLGPARADSTPRSVVLGTPRLTEDAPSSPRSPRSPGTRRRTAGTPRSPKIDGMDYYDWADLLRSSSL